MMESSPACPGPNYSYIVHSPEGNISLAPELNYITNIVLELKVELAKIKVELKELKNHLTVVHLSLINEVRYNEKTTPRISTPFQHKYPFQNPKNKIPFPWKEIKIQKEVEKQSCVKSAEKKEKADRVWKNPEELNKIIGAISNKHDVLSDGNEETNNVQLKEEIYQQMYLIKLRDLNVLPLEEIRRKLDKKYGKMTNEN